MPGRFYNGNVIDIPTYILSQDPGCGCYLSPMHKWRLLYGFFNWRKGLDGDLSVPHQKRYLLNLLKHNEIHRMLIHGSDFPLPINASGFIGHLLVSKILKIKRIESPIRRDFVIKKKLGFPMEGFTKGSGLIRCRRC